MEAKKFVWRWLAGGLSILLIAEGCATDQQGRDGMRNANGTFEAGGTTYWDLNASAGSEGINPDNYYYHRVTVKNGVSYEEYGYYITHPPGHATGKPGTQKWSEPLSPGGRADRSGRDGDTLTGWHTLITHPGGRPEVESIESGAEVRITHPGG